MPPNCRPECVSSSECPNHLACIRQKCKDPCPGSCGSNAECRVVSHTANCVCLSGYIGNPFSSCQLPPPPPVEHLSVCSPSPCGSNAQCRERNGAGQCTCLPEYIGNPYESCRPECTINSDCPSNKACSNNKCIDPCPGTCGQNAYCQVVKHVPSCTCQPGYTGDPFRYCNLLSIQPRESLMACAHTFCNFPGTLAIEEEPTNPCQPSPCGPNSQCREANGQAVCSCLPEYVGSPPSCRPECVVNSECSFQKTCINNKCADPCPGTCGLNANCHVINHSPICSCRPGNTGNPFTRCYPIPRKTARLLLSLVVPNGPNIAAPPTPQPLPEPLNPCVPSPCGPNSECRDTNGSPSCSCSATYIGSPPNCRPECVINSECPSNLACIREKCQDPCPGSCGLNAQCSAINHVSICTCFEGYTGDPFRACTVQPPTIIEEADPCNPSPCGPNARCDNGVCTCLEEFQGDPYQGCRPECTVSNDCPRDKACIRSKCADPCPGTCGQNAQCKVYEHVPMCSCLPGLTGNAFVLCSEIQGF